MIKRVITLLIVAIITFSAVMTPSLAVQPDEILADSAMEGRARAMSAQLRCLVCQNQSIDDSNAPLARDLRLIVRERLTAGDGDAAVLNFVVARYGTFVLLRPPVERSTLLLWATPILLLACAGWILGRRWRLPALADAPPAPLSADEVARLDRLTKS